MLEESERLNFSITDLTDVPALQMCLNDLNMAKSITFIEYPYTTAMAQNWTERAKKGMENRTEWLFSAYLKDQNIYIGSVNLHAEGDKVAEVGYWVSQDFNGNGFGGEMLKFALRYGFEVLELDKIIATTALNNIASQKILEKNGFKNIRQVTCSSTESDRPSYLFEIQRSS